MGYLDTLWRKLTQTKALETCGPLERSFFESVYRLSFITGISTSDDYIKYTVYCYAVRIASVLMVASEIWRVLSNMDKLSMDELISFFNVIFIDLVALWKLIIMISNKDVFKKLAKALESPSFDISTQRRKKIVKYWVTTHNKYLKVLLTLACLTVFVWDAYPLIDELEYNLMVDVALPVNFDSPLSYAITYIVVGTSFSYASFIIIMLEVIMQAHLIPLICQYDVLADCFENLFEECAVDYEDVNKDELVKDKIFVDRYVKRLGDLVKQHRQLLDQTTDLKTILSSPMLGQLACGGLLICLVGYQATTTIAENIGKFVMSLLYLGYSMFTLYLICRWCEEITLQSHRVGDSAYCSGWENGILQTPGVRATIILVIARANKPLVFLAGGMYALSLTSYTSLVKASYSALNLLLSMRHE